MNQLKHKETLEIYESLMKKEDEMSLMALLSILWKGKWWIAGFTFIFTLIAIIYALSAQQWWTAKGIIKQQEGTQLYEYRTKINSYADVISYEGLNTGQLFGLFLEEFEFENNKRAFIESSNEMREVEMALKVDFETNLDKLKFYDKWFERIEVEPLSKEQPHLKIISYQSIDQESSQKLLNNYIDYINNIVNQKVLERFQYAIDTQYNRLNFSKDYLEGVAKENLRLDLLKTKESLKIAEQAKIVNPVENLGGTGMFSLNIGSKGLQGKLEVLESINQNLAENLDLFQGDLNGIYLKLDYLNKNKTVSLSKPIVPYQFVADIQEPLKRDQPKRALIAIIGFLVGIMIGCGFVLVRFSVKEKK